MSVEADSDPVQIKRRQDQRRGAALFVIAAIGGFGWWIMNNQKATAYVESCKSHLSKHEKHTVEFKQVEAGANYRDKRGNQIEAAWSRFSYKINYPLEWQLRNPKAYIEDAAGVLTCFSDTNKHFSFAQAYKKGLGNVCFGRNGEPDFGCF